MVSLKWVLQTLCFAFVNQWDFQWWSFIQQAERVKKIIYVNKDISPAKPK